MNAILGYMILGLSLAAPIGPINAAQLDRGIKMGFWHAWILGLGAASADIFYILLVYFGLVHFLDIPFLKTFLWLFGFFVLCYTGIEGIMKSGNIQNERHAKKESLIKSFFSGFFMSISNPLTILFWLGIYGSVLANAAEKYETKTLIIYSTAIFSGIFLWDITMALMASSARKYLTGYLLRCISVISGLSLIGFGIYFGFQAIKLLFL